uniref:Uncharacterized protein n=1 Tax=Micrurus spixii TaxID=129469 RepID=A0A2D4MVV5_9SAUR
MIRVGRDLVGHRVQPPAQAGDPTPFLIDGSPISSIHMSTGQNQSLQHENWARTSSQDDFSQMECRGVCNTTPINIYIYPSTYFTAILEAAKKKLRSESVKFS